jgi:hypothetical protein
MPSREQHLRKASDNKTFADSIENNNTTEVGWALTVLFYSALHYIEAYNAKYGFHCNTHRQLNDDIARNPVLNPVSDEYSDLQNFSWNARYKAVNYGRNELAECLGYHATIKQHVTNLLEKGY